MWEDESRFKRVTLGEPTVRSRMCRERVQYQSVMLQGVENLVSFRPPGDIPALGCRQQLVAVFERQTLIVGGPGLKTIPQQSRSSEYAPLGIERRINPVCDALASDVGPMEASPRCVHERKRPSDTSKFISIPRHSDYNS